ATTTRVPEGIRVMRFSSLIEEPPSTIRDQCRVTRSARRRVVLAVRVRIGRGLSLAAAFVGRHAVVAERRETVAVAAAVRVLAVLTLRLVGLRRGIGLAGHLCLLPGRVPARSILAR